MRRESLEKETIECPKTGSTPTTADLRSSDTLVMHRSLVDFVDRLAVARNLAEIRRETLNFFNSAGYPDVLFAYAQDPRPLMPQLPGYLFSERIRKLWYERAPEKRFLIPDEVRDRILQQTRPFLWTQDGEFPSSGGWFTDADEWVCAKGECILSYFGIVSSFVVPLRASAARLPGAFFIGSGLGAKEFGVRIDTYGNVLWLGALAAHEYMCQVRAHEVAKTVHLSAREAECLQWLSRGLRNERIAERMSIAVPTVDLHLANARRKLSAQTREQALVIALGLGLITPGGSDGQQVK